MVLKTFFKLDKNKDSDISVVEVKLDRFKESLRYIEQEAEKEVICLVLKASLAYSDFQLKYDFQDDHMDTLVRMSVSIYKTELCKTELIKSNWDNDFKNYFSSFRVTSCNKNISIIFQKIMDTVDINEKTLFNKINYHRKDFSSNNVYRDDGEEVFRNENIKVNDSKVVIEDDLNNTLKLKQNKDIYYKSLFSEKNNITVENKIFKKNITYRDYHTFI